MTIALLLRGISYLRNYQHYTGANLTVDYRDTFDNLKTMLIDPLINKYKDVDVFIATYNSILTNKLIEDYNPKEHIFIDYHESSKQMDLYQEGLKLLNKQDNIMNYELIIICRFDLELKQSIVDLNFKQNKFNFLWNEHGNRPADCIHIFPPIYLDPFINTLEISKFRTCLHCILELLSSKINKNNIHYILDEAYDSNSDRAENPIYKIIRKNYEPDKIVPFSNLQKFLKTQLFYH